MAAITEKQVLEQDLLKRDVEIVKLRTENEALKSAEKTLLSLGYTYCGGEYWKPPLGDKPKFDLSDNQKDKNKILVEHTTLIEHVTRIRECQKDKDWQMMGISIREASEFADPIKNRQ